MKKYILVLTKLLLIIFLFTSCQGNNYNSNNDNKASSYTTNILFPFKSDIRMKYTSTGPEGTSNDVYIDFIKENRIQQRIISVCNVVGWIYEVKDGELRLITTKDGFSYREDLTGTVNNNPEILLKEPIKSGTKWDIPNGGSRTITGIDVEIQTPSGKYNAVEVTSSQKDTTRKDYFAPNVGLVKSIIKWSDGYSYEVSLSKIEDNIPLNQVIKCYYPDFNNDMLVYKKNRIELKTNDTIDGVFEKYFKYRPSNEIINIISENTKVKSIHLSPLADRVNVDFSKEFVNEMNAGTSMEAMLLQCVTNTLGDYYNLGKVYISIEGKPYESGHVMLKENEAFTVDYSNIQELK